MSVSIGKVGWWEKSEMQLGIYIQGQSPKIANVSQQYSWSRVLARADPGNGEDGQKVALPPIVNILSVSSSCSYQSFLYMSTSTNSLLLEWWPLSDLFDPCLGEVHPAIQMTWVQLEHLTNSSLQSFNTVHSHPWHTVHSRDDDTAVINRNQLISNTHKECHVYQVWPIGHWCQHYTIQAKLMRDHKLISASVKLSHHHP